MAGKSRTATRRETAHEQPNQRTVVVPLPVTDDQLDTLIEVAGLYNRARQSLAAWYCNNRTTSRLKAQRANYHRLRERYPDLMSQYLLVAQRDAAGQVRSWNSNHPDRKWDAPTRRRSLTLGLDLRLMSLRGNLLTVSTTPGHPRIRVMLPDLPDWFVCAYPDRKVNAAKIIIDPATRTARIALIFRVPAAPAPQTGTVMGVDLGVRALYTTSEGGDFSSARVRAARRRYAHNRKTLQAKGTRSARRRLAAMKGREKRFIRDVNHQASKALATTPGIKAIAFEDLAYIRRQATRSTPTGKHRRNLLNQWSFSQLQEMTTYKAAARGIPVIMIDPAYTSQRCNRCGHVDKRNRDRSRFDCRRCGHSTNADLNAARNIADRALMNHTPSDRPEGRAPSTAPVSQTPTTPHTVGHRGTL